LDIVIAAVHVNRSIRSSEIKRGTKNERWKERVEKNGREGRGERFSRWEHEGGGGGEEGRYRHEVHIHDGIEW